jgi:hypothetical protein
MTAASLTLTHMDTGVVYYHQNDERAFFEWLSRPARRDSAYQFVFSQPLRPVVMIPGSRRWRAPE